MTTPQDLAALVTALRAQRQIDMDGCEVAVSRQACDEAADALESQAEENRRLREALIEAAGCFSAAEVEGLIDRINGREFYDDHDIYGLVVRRLLPAAEVIRAALSGGEGE